jgi:hypothetical protein
MNVKLNIAFWVLLVLLALLTVTRLGHSEVNPKLFLMQTLFDPITWTFVVVAFFWQKRRQSKVS